MTVVLGIDLGISGARAAVFRNDGQLLGRGSVLAMQKFAGESRRERSVADWFQLVIETVRQAHAAAGECKIDAIGVGALGPCPVLIDDKLQPLTGAPLFSLDGGAEAIRQSLKEKIGRAHV